MSTVDALRRLLEHDDAPIDRAVLYVAEADGRPVDVDACLSALDDLAAPLLADPPGERLVDQAERLAVQIGERGGFRGNTDDYYDPDNSYLDRVLRRRVGIPISLSVVWIAVGRRAGLQVDGVGFPGHFLARVGGDDGVLVDPFAGGEIVDDARMQSLTRKFLGDPSRFRSEHLASVGTASIVIRMITNLEVAHRRRGETARALVCADRLYELTGVVEYRRNRGLYAFSLESFAVAADDLQAYLRARPRAKDGPRIRHVLEEARRHGTPDLQ